jgi:hypothetical protein
MSLRVRARDALWSAEVAAPSSREVAGETRDFLYRLIRNHENAKVQDERGWINSARVALETE